MMGTVRLTGTSAVSSRGPSEHAINSVQSRTTASKFLDVLKRHLTTNFLAKVLHNVRCSIKRKVRFGSSAAPFYDTSSMSASEGIAIVQIAGNTRF